MRNKPASMFGILAVLLLVASFVVPGNLANPSAAQADPGICKWDVVFGPDHLPLASDVDSPLQHGVVAAGILAFPGFAAIYPALGGWKGQELTNIVTGGDGRTALITTTSVFANTDFVNFAGLGVLNAEMLFSPMQLRTTGSMAIAFSPYPYVHLAQEMVTGEGYETLALGPGMMRTLVHGNVWNVAIAPDDPKFWAVVTSGPGLGITMAAQDAPLEVWITTNAGASWQRTRFVEAYNGLGGAADVGTISCIDISPNYGGKRDIAVGVRNGAIGNLNIVPLNAQIEIFTLQSTGFTGWRLQNQFMPTALIASTANADVMALKFSPTYVGDASLAVVFSDDGTVGATYFDIMRRDLDQNQSLGWVYSMSPEIKDPMSIAASSPDANDIVSADLELPSDFSGQSPSLRRAYVSIDSAPSVAATNESGIYRIDNTYIYELMDTTGLPAVGRRISSIAYFGTYASGKLIAGEVIGDCCTASVPTWFTDSPTTCPIPCWYPALKPPTGAAGLDNTMACTCVIGGAGYGNAKVAWNADGTLAYALTGSYEPENFLAGIWFNAIHPAQSAVGGIVVPKFHDENAVNISRNNGETWNQTAYIDTNLNQIGEGRIAYLNDMAIAPDCTTLYLASASVNNTALCISFDSVWRTTINPSVAAPLPVIPPLGFWYERVLTRPTEQDCMVVQTDLPLLRLAPDKTTGELVGWGAQGTRAQMWSPDFGDFWATITPRNNIQDFAFESSTLLWDLDVNAIVQKMPYTGTAWSSAEADQDGLLFQAHMITAKPEGKLLIGAGSVAGGALYPVSSTMNSGQNWAVVRDPINTPGNVHVAFDNDFDNNNLIYAATDGFTLGGAWAAGSIYRYQLPWPAGGRWIDSDMLAATNGNCVTGPMPAWGFFGIQMAKTGTALYATSSNATVGTTGVNAAVMRTLWPRDGMPKPGIAWDILNIYVTPPATAIRFTLEPWSLKLCGCLTMDTDTVLYAIDDKRPVSTGLLVSGYRPATRQGLVWAFTDCMGKAGPTLITADGTLIGCDPVSGRAQEVNLCWEQLCIADRYDIEIAKDAAFTIRVIDWVMRCDATLANLLQPADLLTPCVYIPAGGALTLGTGADSAIAVAGNLECGHKYFWRVQVRECASTQLIHSLWSNVNSFTIKAGLPVRADYYGLKLLAPDNGCLGCPVKPASFSWSPFKETTKYKFVLAKDAAMTQVLAEAEVPTTAYEYKGALDYSTNYFWRVMCLEPAPSDWSATFSFQTEAAPAAPVAPEAAPPTPLWVWVVIAIGAILVIVTLVLIFKTRRV